MIALADWHKRLHEITGAMAANFTRATPSDVTSWAWELHAIATAMASAARESAVPESNTTAPVSETMPEALRRRILRR
jgi:hypothetical protein